MLHALAKEGFLNKGCFRFYGECQNLTHQIIRHGAMTHKPESSGQSRKHEPAYYFKWVHILMTDKPFLTSFP